MSWTAVGLPLTFSETWQYTDPIAGSLFRFTYTGSPVSDAYLIAQVRLADNQDLEFFDIQTITADKLVQIVELNSPDYFGASRRIGFRFLRSPATLESSLRSIISPLFLQPQGLYYPRSSFDWTLNIEVSDATQANSISAIAAHIDALASQLTDLTQIVAAIGTQTNNLQSAVTSLSQALTPLLQQVTTISSQETALASSISTLHVEADQILQLVSTDSGPSGTALNHVADGDTGGLFYWIGANHGTATWTNPVTAGRLIVAVSAPYQGDPSILVSRQDNNNFFTNDVPGNTITFDLGPNHSLVLKGYSFRAPTPAYGRYIRNWNMRGSNDDNTWDILNVQVNNAGINNSNQWLYVAVSEITASYRYIQIQSTGVDSGGNNFIMLGQVELYGVAT